MAVEVVGVLADTVAELTKRVDAAGVNIADMQFVSTSW